MLNLSPWSLPLKIIACVFHSIAIACTLFRLSFRWYLAHFWWEDGLAAFALCADALCLAATWLAQPATAQGTPPINNTTNWIVALGFVCVLWACRLSILCSIIRIVNPSEPFRRVGFAIGCSFVIMWIALLSQKIFICTREHCKVAASVGLSQLITDVISDSALVLLPIYFLRRTKINSKQRITIFSVFSASMLITAVTILHSIALFTVQSDGIVVIGHVKTALSLIVCNLLVMVAFFYRISRRGKGNDLEETGDEVPFTTVDLNTGLSESAANKRTMVSHLSTAPDSFFTTTKSSVMDEKADVGTTTSRPVH